VRIEPGPRDVGRIIDDALVLYRDNFRTLMLSAAAILLPPVLLMSAAAGATYTVTMAQVLSGLEGAGIPGATYAQPTGAMFVTGLLQTVMYLMVPARFVAQVWLSSSVHRSTPDWMAGKPQTVREFLSAGKDRVLQLGVARLALSILGLVIYYVVAFAAGLLSVLVLATFAAGGVVGIVIGLAVVVILGLLGLTGYLLALSPFQAWGPAVVLEDGRVGTALSRSFALVRGRTWRTVGYWMSVWMVSYAVRFAVYGPALLVFANWLGPVFQDPSAAVAMPPLWMAGLLGISAGLGEIFAMPFERACWTQYYLDLRSRGEGMDLVMRARELATARV
jgi:hypothetical protein